MPSKLPWRPPMLATLSKQPFSDPKWLYERKLDGMRCLLYKEGNKISIWSRNKKLQNNFFPEIVNALKKYSSDFILDSEVVALDDGKTSFELLQSRMHVKDPNSQLIKQVPLTVYIFDIIYLNGYELAQLPLVDRKKIIKQNFKFTKPLKYLPHKKNNGLELLKTACSLGWEGLIAKLATSKYIHKRTTDWLKFKCSSGQEFIIAGYTHPQGSRLKFGALLLGYYNNGKLLYAGKVGTGFNVELLLLLHKKMSSLIIKKSPFEDYNSNDPSIVWLKPKLIAEVEFSEWTSEGKLRHPRFKGLRDDKKPENITRECLDAN